MTPLVCKFGLVPRTVSETFVGTVLKYGSREALRYVKQGNTDTQSSSIYSKSFDQISYTWEGYNRESRGFAKALMAKDFQPHRVVTIQGSNSPQWLFANIGTILAAGVSAGIYSTNNANLSKHAVKSSKAQVVVVENATQLKKYAGLDATTPVKCFVVWDKLQRQEKEFLQAKLQGRICSWEEFIREGEHIPDRELDRRIEGQSPEQVCSLIYTSGTTGMPKAAALTHRNLTWTASVLGRELSMHAGDRGICYLPLSHIASQQLDCILPLTFGCSVYIAPSDVLKGDNLKQHLVHARSTYFLGVPRAWEKFKEGIEEKVKTSSPSKRALFQVSTKLGRTAFNDLQRIHSTKPEMITLMQKVRRAADTQLLSALNAVIFSRIKAALGLDYCKITASGAGPLDSKIPYFFRGLNIRVINLYGLSETSAASGTPFDPATPDGSCGKALPDSAIAIAGKDETGEGEVLLKGPHVFQGYWDDAKATEEVFDENGYFRTGDKGKIDNNGYLSITGRLKEVIKTSGGEHIPLIRIENTIKSELPMISQAVVICDKRKFVTCLLTLRTEVDSNGNPTERLDKSVIEQFKALGSPAVTTHQAVRDEKVRKFIQAGIDRANKQADSAAQYVRKFDVLKEDFSVSNEMLTPTLKLRRNAIAATYAREIDTMYGVQSAS